MRHRGAKFALLLQGAAEAAERDGHAGEEYVQLTQRLDGFGRKSRVPIDIVRMAGRNLASDTAYRRQQLRELLSLHRRNCLSVPYSDRRSLIFRKGRAETQVHH